MRARSIPFRHILTKLFCGRFTLFLYLQYFDSLSVCFRRKYTIKNRYKNIKRSHWRELNKTEKGVAQQESCTTRELHNKGDTQQESCTTRELQNKGVAQQGSCTCLLYTSPSPRDS